jgi:competence CoiA-like predicted nuclease
MIYANLNGEKIEATPKTRAICPLCELTVFSKCGELNVWHWSHLKGESCDAWYEPETEWHLNWKLVFGKEQSEIVIKRNGKKHIADVLTKNGVVIELQNSPIQSQIVRKREEFYGEKMLWVINGYDFEYNFELREISKEIVEEYYWNSYVREEIPPPNQKKEYNFHWKWARKSWHENKRPLFIDFGNEFLYWVKQGMGTSFGKCDRILKKRFIEKYGGDIKLLQTVVNQKKTNERHIN